MGDHRPHSLVATASCWGDRGRGSGESIAVDVEALKGGHKDLGRTGECAVHCMQTLTAARTSHLHVACLLSGPATDVWFYHTRPSDEVLRSHRFFCFGFALTNTPRYTIDTWGVGVVGDRARPNVTGPLVHINKDIYEREGWVDHFTYEKGKSDQRKKKDRAEVEAVQG